MSSKARAKVPPPISLGYKLSSEEQTPSDLVRYAQMAEESGFTFALISDHYHPWIDRQGQSPFVWSVLGAIAQATTHLTHRGHGRHMSHRADSSGHHCAGGGDHRGADARPIRPRPWHG